MAPKKPEEPVTVDTSTMNVWAKLLAARAEFYTVGAKKSGKNLHAEFKYFELEDIVPVAEPIFKKHGLLFMTRFSQDTATGLVMNTDNVEEVIIFTIPLIFISEPAKFRMNEVQGVGAAVTYYRRYLYMLVLDLVESDGFDSQDGSKNLTEEDAPKKPATAEERKAAKKELTSEPKAASAEGIKELKGLLKKLLACDPGQEEFVQSVAIKTDNFKKLTETKLSSLIEGVKSMISEYGEE